MDISPLTITRVSGNIINSSKSTSLSVSAWTLKVAIQIKGILPYFWE